MMSLPSTSTVLRATANVLVVGAAFLLMSVAAAPDAQAQTCDGSTCPCIEIIAETPGIITSAGSALDGAQNTLSVITGFEPYWSETEHWTSTFSVDGESCELSAYAQYNGNVQTTITGQSPASTSVNYSGNAFEAPSLTDGNTIDVSTLPNGNYTATVTLYRFSTVQHTATFTFTINARPVPTCTVSVSPNPINWGGAPTVSWTTSPDITGCTASGSWSGAKSASGGNETLGAVDPPNKTYSLSCTGTWGTAICGTTLTVNQNGGTGVFSQNISRTDQTGTTTYSVTNGPINTCGALHTTRDGIVGAPHTTNWICTNASGNVTKALNLPDPLGDQDDQNLKIVWENGRGETNTNWHIWDHTNPTVTISSTAGAGGVPPTSFAGTSSDPQWSSGFGSGEGFNHLTYLEVETGRWWRSGRATYDQASETLHVGDKSPAGETRNMTWSTSSMLPPESAHVCGRTYRWYAKGWDRSSREHTASLSFTYNPATCPSPESTPDEPPVASDIHVSTTTLGASLTLNANVQNPSGGGLSYQWYTQSACQGTAVSGQSGPSYQVAGTGVARLLQYSYRVTNTSTGLSDCANATLLWFESVSTSSTVAVGSAGTFRADLRPVAAENAPVTVAWFTNNTCTTSAGFPALFSIQETSNTLQTKTYYFRVTDPIAGVSEQCRASTVTWSAADCPVISSFSSDSPVTYNTAATLTWATANAEAVTINGAARAVNGSWATPALTSATVYELTATKTNCASVSQQLTVHVLAPVCPVIQSFTASPTSILSGQSSNLEWATTGTAQVRLIEGGDVAASTLHDPNTSGSPVAVSPSVSKRFTIRAIPSEPACTDVVEAHVDIDVTAVQPPSCVLNAAPATLPSAGSTLLSWSSTNATSCVASSPAGWTSGTAISSSGVPVTVNETTTFEMRCSGPTGLTAVCERTVCVGASCYVPPSPASWTEVGNVCVDSQTPLLPVDTAHAYRAELVQPEDGAVRGTTTYLRATGEIRITAKYRDDHTCGVPSYALRLQNDDGTVTYGFQDGVRTTEPTGQHPLELLSAEHIDGGDGSSTFVAVLRARDGAPSVRYGDVRVDVRDAAGNLLSIAGGPIAVDNTAPTCELLVPDANGVVTDFPFIIRARASDTESIGSGLGDPVTRRTTAEFRYLHQGDEIGTASHVWQPSLNPAAFASFQLDSPEQEFNQIQMTLRDIVGNSCIVDRTFFVDRTAPQFVRALPISRGFITTAVDTITLEFFEEDVTGSDPNPDNVSLCNPSDPPDSDDYRIALFDVTTPETAAQPLAATLSPSCSGDFPVNPVRTTGETATLQTPPNGLGNSYFTFLQLRGDDPQDGPPNRLIRGRSYELRIRNVRDIYGNVMPGLIRVPFSFYGPSQPLRVTKQVTTHLESQVADPTTLVDGKVAEIARAPKDWNISAATNCLANFTTGPGRPPLASNPYLAAYRLSLVNDVAPGMTTDDPDAALFGPFTLTDTLPPYFHVIDADCGGATQVRAMVYDAAGAEVGTYFYLTLAPTLLDPPVYEDANGATIPFVSYGRNVDRGVPDAERGRKLSIPYPADAPPIPAGGRLDVLYYSYVAGYEQSP